MGTGDREKYGCNICPAAPELVAPTSLELTLNDGQRATGHGPLSIANSSTTPTAADASTAPEVIDNQASPGLDHCCSTTHDHSLGFCFADAAPSPRSLLSLPAPLGPSSTRPRSPCSRPSSPAATLAACQLPQRSPAQLLRIPIPQQSAPHATQCPGPGAYSYESGITACLRAVHAPQHTHREDTQGGGPRRPNSHNGAPATVRNGRRHGSVRQHACDCSRRRARLAQGPKQSQGRRLLGVPPFQDQV